MANGERALDGALRFSDREDVREKLFKRVWTQELNDVFADVAKYYDRANYVASLGLWNKFRNSFLATIELQSGQRALDVCAGTNAVGIAMLRKQPDLKVCAMDRSAAMQEVGRQLAEQEGFHIESVIGDVHKLPFPDNHFDVVTLQWASRHLRVMDVYAEIRRVLNSCIIAPLMAHRTRTLSTAVARSGGTTASSPCEIRSFRPAGFCSKRFHSPCAAAIATVPRPSRTGSARR